MLQTAKSRILILSDWQIRYLFYIAPVTCCPVVHWKRATSGSLKVMLPCPLYIRIWKCDCFTLIVSEINSLLLSVNLVPVSLSLTRLSCSYHIFSLCWFTTLAIYNSLTFRSRPKAYLFHKTFPTVESPSISGWLHDSWRDRFFWASRFLFFLSFSLRFCGVPCGRSCFLVRVKTYGVSYRIVGCAWKR